MRSILPLLVLVVAAAAGGWMSSPEPAAGEPAAAERAAAEPDGETKAPPSSRGAEQAPEARAAMAAVAAAWRQGDHEALSRLVSAGGVDVAIAPLPDRDVRYSRSQAFYFFKTVFRSKRTETFSLERLQPVAGGERIHAVVAWTWLHEGSADPEAERLLLALLPEPDGWRLAEIRSLR